MKAELVFFFLIFFSEALSAQDTIFVRNGQPIPAIIVEKNSAEIKYRKFGKPESAAIYSLFTSDILSIHYKDGIVADYTQEVKQQEKTPTTAIEMAGTQKVFRVSIGLGAEYFSRYTWDEFLPAWRYSTGIQDAQIGGRQFSFPIILKLSGVLGNLNRNWFGDEVKFVSLPDAISAKENGGSGGIKLSDFNCNIMLFYGRTLNTARNIAAILEAGLDLSFGLHGYVKLTGKTYNYVTSVGSAGPHFAIGADWVILKRLTASCRIGYRFLKKEELEFYNGPNDWGYFPKAETGGPYINCGLCANFYFKSPFAKPPK